MSQDSLRAIGAAIGAARKAQGRSQAELAASLHMSRATISGIENGTVREIGVRKVLGLCAALSLELLARPRRARPTLQELREEQRGAKDRA